LLWNGLVAVDLLRVLEIGAADERVGRVLEALDDVA
jgi:hypothetical protein